MISIEGYRTTLVLMSAIWRNKGVRGLDSR